MSQNSKPVRRNLKVCKKCVVTDTVDELKLFKEEKANVCVRPHSVHGVPASLFALADEASASLSPVKP